MKLFFKIALLTILTFNCTSVAFAKSYNENIKEKNYFQFNILKYHTQRQFGQTVSVYIRYAYIKDLPENEYPDYRKLRTTVLKYMEPSSEYPNEVFWEILATRMGRDLMKNYPLGGVSVQLDVLDNQNPDPNEYEPGDHGPIFTIGEIEPLDIHK